MCTAQCSVCGHFKMDWGKSLKMKQKGKQQTTPKELIDRLAKREMTLMEEIQLRGRVPSVTSCEAEEVRREGCDGQRDCRRNSLRQ